MRNGSHRRARLSRRHRGNSDREYTIYWRNDQGVPNGGWSDIHSIPNLARESRIWHKEFQRNDYFRRRGTYDGSPDPSRGDFDRLKELVTEYLKPGTGLFPVRNHLIRAYQYLMAKFDLDGYRIDTLQYVEPDFARVFGNAMRGCYPYLSWIIPTRLDEDVLIRLKRT